PDHPKTRHLIAGVVAGIGGYGNCVGVPTVGGEVNFDAAYDGNILVNAMTVGIAEQDKIFYSAASGIGNSIIYVGSKTGRDGIHGATMASADFSEDSEEKRPTVQVGDPFTEKLLIEACLELMASDAIVAIQDMGAAGLTSSSVEMASKGGVGIRLNMNAVPCREQGMTPYEIMLSESQERMLMVLKPGREDFAEAIFKKWELDFAVIGEVTEAPADGGHMVLEWNGAVVADIPLGPLADEAPLYQRPWVATPKPAPLTDVPNSSDITADLLTLMASPAIASRQWIWEQYDSQVGADTVQTGGDAAIVRIHGTSRGLAMTTDCTPRYCYADPVEGGKQAIAEAYRNLCAVGAKPLAVTNCLNFGNPQRPEIMGQIVGCLEGMSQACIALDMPIVSGNVSLYNETKNDDGSGSAILPTPAIGAVGVIEDVARAATIAFKAEGEAIVLIGHSDCHVGQSLWLKECHSRSDGPPPPVDLAAERRAGELVGKLIASGLVTAVHDCSDGGAAIALAEMALAGGIGHRMTVVPQIPNPAAILFGEDQGRFVVTTADPAAIRAAANAAQLFAVEIGTTGGDRLTFDLVDRGGEQSVSLAELRVANEGFFPNLMGADAALA
ncbi:MAG: phosphoribosylformylglycinamidine synthase subunit PurL, partial [Pseudomonadota bacterium]|nr:phosphoribosylformylglycinamidine synthase subunit PurL [Pseudomonadota bacterium]